MVSELFHPRQEVVASDGVGISDPRKIPSRWRSVTADRPSSVSGYGGAPAYRPSSLSGYGGAPVVRPSSLSEQDYPRQQMVWSDWCGWYVPSKPPKFLPALAADRPYSSSASARRPWPSRSIASSSSSLSGYGGGPYRQEMGVIGLGSSACKIPSRFHSESALEPYLPRQIPDSSDLRRRRGPAELALAVSGPDRREVKVPHSTPSKIPNPSPDLGKMKEWVVSYEEDASDPTAIWRIASASNWWPSEEPKDLPDLVPPAELEKEKTRRVEDLRQINPSSTQGVHLHGTPEGNHISLPTGYSVVANGWDEDPLPHACTASPTLNNLNPTTAARGVSEEIQKFDLTQLYMGKRADKRLRCTGLLWKLPPWPDFCAMNCDLIAHYSGYEVLANFHSVKKYHISLNKASEFNDYGRSHQPPNSLIKTEVCGLLGSVFCDFGPEITVLDVDGEDTHIGITASISNDNPALVSCVDGERLEFQDGDLVVLSEVQGMTELIDEKHPFIEERVKVLHSMKPLQLDDMVIGQHKSLHCYFIWVMLEYSKFSSLDSDEPFARKFNNLIHRQLAEFNYLQFKAVYRPEEYTGYAVVLFTKDGNETNPYGKYIYGWLAKEEDYKSGDPVGRFLSEKGDLKAVNDMEHDLTTRVVKDQESVYALVMNDTGSLLVSSSTERVVRVWDPGTGSKSMKMRHVVEEERNMLQLSKVWQQGLFKEPKEKQLHVSGHKWGRIETSGNMLSFNVVTSSNDKGKDMPLEEVSAVTWFPEDGHSNGEIKLPQNTPQAASVDNRKKEPNTKPTNFVENGSYTKDLDEVLVCKSQASALNISACNSTINEEPVIHSKESHKSQDEDVSKNCSQTSHNRKSANNNNYQAVATVVLKPKNSRTSLCVEVEQSKAKFSGTDNIKSSKFMPSILTVGSLSSIRGGHSVTLNPSKRADESSERNAKPSERTGKEATGIKVHIWDPNYVPVQNQKKGLYVKSVQHTEIWMRNPEEITKEECAAFTELNSAKVYASPIKLQVFTFAEAYEFENLESMLQEVYAPGCVDCDAQSKNIEKWAKHYSGLDNRKSVRIEASVNEHPKWQKLSQRNVMRFFKEMLQIADVETVPTTDNSKFAAAVTHMDFLDEQFHIRAFDKEALIMTSRTGSVKESSALQFKDSFKENSVLVEHEIDAGLIRTRGSFVSPVVHMAVQCKVASDLPSSLKVESAWQNLTPWKNLTNCYGFPDFHT